MIDASSRSLSEVDRIISRGLGNLRCPQHGSPVTYEAPALETQNGGTKTTYSVEVICCCEELLQMARNTTDG